MSQHFTPRELDILRLWANRPELSYKQQAHELGISKKTLDSMNCKVRLKLGARNAPEAAVKAVLLGFRAGLAFRDSLPDTGDLIDTYGRTS